MSLALESQGRPRNAHFVSERSIPEPRRVDTIRQTRFGCWCAALPSPLSLFGAAGRTDVIGKPGLTGHPCEDYQERPARAVWCCTVLHFAADLQTQLRSFKQFFWPLLLTSPTQTVSRACSIKQSSSMGLTMAQHRQAPSQFKEEPGHDSVSATFRMFSASTSSTRV